MFRIVSDCIVCSTQASRGLSPTVPTAMLICVETAEARPMFYLATRWFCRWLQQQEVNVPTWRHGCYGSIDDDGICRRWRWRWADRGRVVCRWACSYDNEPIRRTLLIQLVGGAHSSAARPGRMARRGLAMLCKQRRATEWSPMMSLHSTNHYRSIPMCLAVFFSSVIAAGSRRRYRQPSFLMLLRLHRLAEAAGAVLALDWLEWWAP